LKAAARLAGRRERAGVLAGEQRVEVLLHAADTRELVVVAPEATFLKHRVEHVGVAGLGRVER
jgi:hypothetical protein